MNELSVQDWGKLIGQKVMLKDSGFNNIGNVCNVTVELIGVVETINTIKLNVVELMECATGKFTKNYYDVFVDDNCKPFLDAREVE